MTARWLESPLQTLSTRLLPGTDLKQALTEVVQQHELPAACILSCVGSLKQASLRMAGQKETEVFIGPWEIVSLTGTLSPTGIHLHVAVSDTKGDTIGGHLMDGSTIHTTAEIIIGVLPALLFRREPDAKTGYNELIIERSPDAPTRLS
ncbi:MAG: DNA-binding protein [Myxococcales bacterium]|nr:DNA-binding protein [Myxococcales bacterium]MCB9643484.1 DNA-binding protein [Myxococcales bacterium]